MQHNKHHVIGCTVRQVRIQAVTDSEPHSWYGKYYREQKDWGRTKTPIAKSERKWWVQCVLVINVFSGLEDPYWMCGCRIGRCWRFRGWWALEGTTEARTEGMYSDDMTVERLHLVENELSFHNLRGITETMPRERYPGDENRQKHKFWGWPDWMQALGLFRHVSYGETQGVGNVRWRMLLLAREWLGQPWTRQTEM